MKQFLILVIFQILLFALFFNIFGDNFSAGMWAGVLGVTGMTVIDQLFFKKETN